MSDDAFRIDDQEWLASRADEISRMKIAMKIERLRCLAGKAFVDPQCFDRIIRRKDSRLESPKSVEPSVEWYHIAYVCRRSQHRRFQCQDRGLHRGGLVIIEALDQVLSGQSMLNEN